MIEAENHGLIKQKVVKKLSKADKLYTTWLSEPECQETVNVASDRLILTEWIGMAMPLVFFRDFQIRPRSSRRHLLRVDIQSKNELQPEGF